MAKVKTRRKPHPRFGATEATGKRHQATRELKNKIFELMEFKDKLQRVRDAFDAAFGAGIAKNREDEYGIDDLFARSVDVHLERMDRHYYWLGLTVNGVTVHIDVVAKKGTLLKATVRK